VLFDRFGSWFTLLVTDRAVDVGPAVRAFAAADVPLDVVTEAGPEVAAAYATPVTVIRPDGHVAWQGDEPGGVTALVAGISRAQKFSSA
jgi:hypothetical protein